MAVFTRLQSKIDTKVLEIEFSWLTYVTIFSGLVEVMALISGVLSQRPISESVIFTTYQVTAILIPGLAYVELLKVEFCKTGAARILQVIFGTGWEIQLLCNRIIRRLIFGR